MQHKAIQKIRANLKIQAPWAIRCSSESRYIGFFAVSGQVEERSCNLNVERYATQN
jgi:hypothetical protein